VGRIARLLRFERTTVNDANVSDVTVDRGGADNRTLQHCSAPGDDSFPLAGDYVQTVEQAGTGRDSATGYIDPKNDQTATPGDKRIYARDATTGDQVAEVWLKSDGTITGSNANGNFELQAGGDFVVNGVTIDTAGNITSPSTIRGNTITQTSNDVTLGTHNHGGSAPVPGT